MKAKAAQALCLLNVGILVSGQQLLANETQTRFKLTKTATQASTTLTSDQKLQIHNAEEFFQEFEKVHGAGNPDYPVRMADLANVYLRNGQIAIAEKTIYRSVEAAKTFRAPELIVPWIMRNYAFEMAKHDKAKARKAIATGLESANKLPFGSSERLQYLQGMIEFYKQIGSIEEANKQIADIDEQLRALEKANGLDEVIIASTAYALRQMSVYFCSPHKQNAGDFRKAESYQLRAIAEFDKLPKEKRIVPHFELQSWYQSFGMTKKSMEQADIVKSLNNGKPYVKQACHGCGLG